MKTRTKTCLVLICILVLASTALLLTACKDEGTLKSVTNIDCDGTSITWQHEDFGNVSNLVFKVTIGDKTETVNALSYQYDAGNKDFSVTVEAVYLAENKLSKDKSGGAVTKNFKALPEIQNVHMEDEVLRWDAVTGATGYIVRMDTASGSTEELVVGTTYDKLIGGSYSVRVRPVNSNASEGWYGTYSAPLTIEVLSAPTGLTYDTSLGTIKWDTVTGASGYVLSIMTVEGINEQQLVTNSYRYSDPDQSFEIKVKAISRSVQVYDSAYSASVKYTHIAPVTDFSVSDGVLKWNATGPEGTQYLVKIDGILTSGVLDSPEYSRFPIGRSTRISIKPILKDGNSFSSWSAEQTITILPAPTGVKFDEGALLWNSVQGAAGYRIEVYKGDSKIEDLNSGMLVTLDVSDYVKEAGKYRFKVYAIADSPNYFDSKASENVNVTRLSAPTNLAVKDDPYDYNKTILSYSGSENANGYTIRYDGVEYTDSNAGTSVNISNAVQNYLEAGVCTISVSANGSYSQQGTDVYLESAVSEIEINKLAVPTGVYIRENRLYFNSVAGANGYVVYIDGTSAGNGHDISVSGEMFSITLTPGEHSLAVRAKGDSATTLSSNLSTNNDNTALIVTKLAPPQISINNNCLYIDSSDNKGSTKIYTNEAVEFVGFESGTDISDKVTTAGIRIYAVTHSGVDNVIDSESSNILTPRKLLAPVNFRLSAGYLQWNTVSGARSYDIYYEDAVRIRSINATSYGTDQLEYIDGKGETNSHFNLSVKAVGDGSNTFDSDKSNMVTFSKLAIPDVRVSADGRMYNWEAVTDAAGYELQIGSNQPIKLSNTVTAWAPEFSAIGANVVKVRAIGDNLTSITSKDYTIEQNVAKLEKPEISASFLIGTGLIINVDNASAYSEYGQNITYSYVSGGSPVSGATESSAVLGSASGVYKVTCTVNGGFFYGGDKDRPESNVFYIGNSSSTMQYTVLSRPTGVELDKYGTADSTATYSLNWKAVGGAQGYSGKIILVKSDGTEITKIVTGSSTRYDLGKLKADGIVKVRYDFNALGNDNDTFTGPVASGELNVV